MEYQVAIPSYKRATICNEKTISMLRANKMDMSRVTVFVANEDDHKIYRSVIPADVKIVTGVLGVAHQRRFIVKYYEKGTRIIQIDDDVSMLMEPDSTGKNLVEVRPTIDAIAKIGFGICEKHGLKLWGICPVANAFYMREEVAIGLKFICGIFMGCYAGDVVFVGARPMQSSGEDFESTLRSFKEYGATVKINWLCPKTKYWAEGGIKTELEEKGIPDRNDNNTQFLIDIASRYPDVCSLYQKAGGVTNIRLKRITLRKYTKKQVISSII
jgi:hypothetical protein